MAADGLSLHHEIERWMSSLNLATLIEAILFLVTWFSCCCRSRPTEAQRMGEAHFAAQVGHR